MGAVASLLYSKEASKKVTPETGFDQDDKYCKDGEAKK
jgi:hypothetical protein